MPDGSYQSKEVRALQSIDSSKYPDTNKDFEKNVRRLNSSVDYISKYMIIMQKGIDDASQNFIEQIQSFINDLIVLLAGGEPTGIDVGDLKYLLQAIGALFGFGTGPFPINLLEAAEHFIFGYVVPLEAFTDMLFDTIAAWAAEFGLPPEFIDSVHDFFNAINDLGDEFDDLWGALAGILNVFNITTDTGPLADLMRAITDLFQPIIDLLPDFKPVLATIAGWTVPFVEGLANVIQFMANVVDFLGDSIDWFTEDFNVFDALGGFITSLLDGGILNGIIDAITNAVGGLGDPGGIFTGVFNTIFNINANAENALSPTNPAVVAVDGRLSALEGTGASFTDLFNRASLGSDWTVVSGAFTTTGNRLNSTNGLAYPNVFSFATAKQYAQATLSNMQYSQALTLGILSDHTSSNLVGFSFYPTSGIFYPPGVNVTLSLSTWIGGTPVVRTTMGITGHDGDVIGIGFDGVDTFKVYQNNVELTTMKWIDTGHVVDITKRGLIVASSGGASINEMAAYDWV
jgi:hypothetical protein